ncbi:MAG TPA: hypothetical protein VL461_02750 [Dictyobacter sp.]|jgi:hypothetical protein|nr:hypothetical protein [Dictyobacter sp.]
MLPDLLFIVIILLVIFLFWNMYRRRKKQQNAANNPRASWTKLPATVKRIDEKKSTHLIRATADHPSQTVERTSYIVVAETHHPHTNEVLTFRSFPFTEYPAKGPGSEVTAVVDLENPTHYELHVK